MDQNIPRSPSNMRNEQGHSLHVVETPVDPWLVPHLVDAFFASCEQGVFVSMCEVFARCGSVALFISPATNQYGVGIISPEDVQRVVECYQYPSRSTAILRFLEQIADPSRPIQ
jgi:hypothetical protein